MKKKGDPRDAGVGGYGTVSRVSLRICSSAPLDFGYGVMPYFFHILHELWVFPRLRGEKLHESTQLGSGMCSRRFSLLSWNNHDVPC